MISLVENMTLCLPFDNERDIETKKKGEWQTFSCAQPFNHLSNGDRVQIIISKVGLFSLSPNSSRAEPAKAGAYKCTWYLIPGSVPFTNLPFQTVVDGVNAHHTPLAFD